MNTPFEAAVDRPPCESAPKNAEPAGAQAPLSPDFTAKGTCAAPPSSYASVCTGRDRVFTVLFFALGLLYVQTVFFGGSFWQIPLFAAAYLGVLAAYAHPKRPFTKPNLFWFGAAALLAISFLYDNTGSFAGVKLAMLHLLAVYTALVLLGGLADQATSNALPADCVRGVFVFPFGNFFALFAALAVRRRPSKNRSSAVWGIVGGIAICVPLLAIIFPLLLAADNSFGELWQQWRSLFFVHSLPDLLFRLLAGTLVAQYLFGLCFGALHKRRAQVLDRPALTRLSEKAHCLPASTGVTVLWVLAGVYLLFMAVQARVLFSAFQGVLPDGFSSYSEYARQGFFELCRVVALNLAVLVGCRTLCQKPAGESAALRYAAGALCLTTYLLIGSAAGRMALYITAYGLTIKRVSTLLLLLFFAVVFTLLLLSDRVKLPIMRISAGLFVTGFVLFALCYPQRCIDRWNIAYGYEPQSSWVSAETLKEE